MATVKVEFHHLAEKDFDDAYKWYLKRSARSLNLTDNAMPKLKWPAMGFRMESRRVTSNRGQPQSIGTALRIIGTDIDLMLS